MFEQINSASEEVKATFEEIKDTPEEVKHDLEEIKEKIDTGITAVHEIHRRGEPGDRFYSATVEGTVPKVHYPAYEGIFHYKRVVPDTEANRDPGNIHSPANHLRGEILTSQFLQSALPENIKIAPRMLAANSGEEPWYASEYLPTDAWLGVPDSPFFFNLDALAKTPPEKIFQGIEILQSLSNKENLPAWITRPDRNQEDAFEMSSDCVNYLVAYLNEHPEILQERGIVLDQLAELHEMAKQSRLAQEKVLIHGEVYPPHIFVSEDSDNAEFIDWENAKLGSQYTDHAAVWLRSLENPEFQSAYEALVSSQEEFDQDAWDAEVFLLATDNFRFLTSMHSEMEDGRRERAAEYCLQTSLQIAQRPPRPKPRVSRERTE